MTRTIAIANQKGGVGKTTSVINLGVALAEMEKKVLVIDLDPQAALSAGLGVDPEKAERTTYTLLVEPDIHVRDVIRPIQAYLDLIPANPQLSQAEIELIPEIRRELTLQRALKPVNGWYDFILIDCPPAINMLTVNALIAADSVLIPMQCEYYALEGLSALVDTIEKLRKSANPRLSIHGILRTMFDPRNNLANEVSAQLQQHFGSRLYRTVIPRNVRLAEAPSFGCAALFHDKYSRGALAYLALAGEINRRETAAA
jgi:chromosome partitioning protein